MQTILQSSLKLILISLTTPHSYSVTITYTDRHLIQQIILINHIFVTHFCYIIILV